MSEHKRTPFASTIGEAALRDAAKEQRDIIIELQSAAFDRAAAYTNLITLGGYAGAFTLWSYTRDQLAPTATILVALLLGISLATFVFFEVYKMVLTSKGMTKQVRLLTAGHPPSEFLRRLQKLRKEDREAKLTKLMRIWNVVMYVCVGTGLSAVAVLFYNFFAILLGWSPWPGA
ncbi:hypothetical protein [Inquilinus sp. CAU 1745]|uniref:hypothetical protein n=1 Tax=Inquilinus sp. CAU 1745 TaxID=3140369 RepID=UPI00325C2549